VFLRQRQEVQTLLLEDDVNDARQPPPTGVAPLVAVRQRAGMKILPWFWETIFLLSGLLVRLRLRVETVGMEKAPRGAVLIAAKHASSWDIPLVCRLARFALGRRAYFQMGSFVGYPILGRIVPFMERCGGFCVMRPKEVLRLRKREGLERDEIHARMERVNRAAEDTRRAVLEEGGVLAFFPEGSRDDTQVRPLKATNELATAVELRFAGVTSTVWPVVLSFGPKRGWRRRRVRIDCLDPLPVTGVSPDPLSAEIERRFRAHWRPPAAV
jgi:1-acyl-sn-glycerol-3-phosphate acyltransferase